jgi:hypothetical protein
MRSGRRADRSRQRVLDVGGGGSGNSSDGAFGYYDPTEVGVPLPAAFASRTLASIEITSNGYETLLFGITAAAVVTSSVPELSTWALIPPDFAGEDSVVL